MQKLARFLKLAKMSPMQLHAVSDAHRAHAAASAAPAARPMVRDPHAFAQHASMMQNPGQYMPQGQVSSGLELATPPRAYKRASELEKLAACLKDNKSWMPEKKKDPSGMAGNEDGAKTSEVQKLSALLNASAWTAEGKKKNAKADPEWNMTFEEAEAARKKKKSEVQKLAELLQKRAGFMQQGMRQLNTAVNNPGMISRGAGKLYNAAGGGLGGVGAVAKHYAPMAGMIAAPIAAGAAGMAMLGGGQPRQPDQTRMASFGPNMRKLAGMMQTVGKGLGMAGKAVGIVPGVGTAIGAGLGTVGGAMAAPPGKRVAGAALGGVTGAMGPIAGTVANMAGSRMLGV
jgi:hypothetical protein